MDLSFLQDKQYLELDEPTRREVFNRMVSSQAETESEEFSTLDDDTRSAVLDHYWNNAPQAEPEPEQGFFSNVLDLAGSGFQKLKTGMPLAADVAGGEFSDDAPEAIHSLLTENGPQPKELKSAVENLSKIGADWEEAKGFMESAGVVGRGMLAIVKEAVTNPKGLAYISAEQVANMAPSIAGMLAGGKLGALGGPAAPVTVPVGAFLGGMAGGAAVEMAIETAGFVDDALQELGLDATEENIRALLSDPDEAEKIISQSRKKAAGTAATDAALTLIGGKIAISGGKGISRMSRAGRIAGGAAVDIAGEGISEAAGQKWSKGKVDMGDVALETFAGVGGAAPSLAGAARALGGVGEEKDTGGGSDVPPPPEQVQARLAAIEEGLYSGDIDLETLGRLDLPKLGLNPDDIDRIVTGFQKSLRDEQAAEGMADIGKAGSVDEAIDAAARATGIISSEMDPASPEAGIKLREDLASRELDGLRRQWPGVPDDRLHEIDSAYQAARRSEAGIEAFRKKYGVYAGSPSPAEQSARVFMEGDVAEDARTRTKAELEPDINKFLRRDEQHLAGSGVEIEPGETDAQDRISIPGELSLNQLVDQAKERLKGVDSKAAIALAKPILDQVKKHGAQQDIIEKSKRAARDFPELQKVFGEIIKPADTTRGTLERDLEKAEQLLAEDPSSRTKQALVDHRRKKLERYGKKPAMDDADMGIELPEIETDVSPDSVAGILAGAGEVSIDEAKQEKAKLKSQVIEGVKSGKFQGAVRFGTVDEIRAAIEKGELPVSKEYGAIHATPILGQDDDMFAAYGAYDKHNMAIIIPPEHIEANPDATTKGVLVKEGIPLDDLTFLIDGHERAYTYQELKAELGRAKSETPSQTAPAGQGEAIEGEGVGRAKEPWEMTKDEFKGKLKSTSSDFREFLNAEEKELDAMDGGVHNETGFHPNAGKASEIKKHYESKLPKWRLSDEGSDHEAHIAKALAEGKPVPPEVLKDYPELQQPKPIQTEPGQVEAGNTDLVGDIQTRQEAQENTFVNNKIQKIDELVKRVTVNGTRPMNINWETKAVKRFIEAELPQFKGSKLAGQWASAKIAAAKARTFDELKSAIAKITAKKQANTKAKPETPSQASPLPQGETIPKEDVPSTGKKDDIVSRVDSAINDRQRSVIFREEGEKAFPEIRMQEVEEAGRWSYLVAKGEVTQAEFDAWKEQMRKENRTRPVKESWEKTPEDYVADMTDPDEIAIAKAAHANHVKQAVQDGKNVPVYVLKKYKHNDWAKKAIDAKFKPKDEADTKAPMGIEDELASMDLDDIEALFDEVVAEKEAEEQPKAEERKPIGKNPRDEDLFEDEKGRYTLMPDGVYKTYEPSKEEGYERRLDSPWITMDERKAIVDSYVDDWDRLTPEGRLETARAIGWNNRDAARISKTAWASLSPAAQQTLINRRDKWAKGFVPDFGRSWNESYTPVFKGLVLRALGFRESDISWMVETKWENLPAGRGLIESALRRRYKGGALPDNIKPNVFKAPENMPDGWKRVPPDGMRVAPGESAFRSEAFGNYMIIGKPGQWRLSDEDTRSSTGGTYTDLETAAKKANQHWIDKNNDKKPSAMDPKETPIDQSTTDLDNLGKGFETSIIGTLREILGSRLSPGKPVTTNTGRKTTPFPEVKTGKINSWKTVKNIDKWVVQNAVDEAVSRGDNFNKRQFEQDAGRKNIPMATKEMAVEYLFGDYIPPVIKSPLKDMVSPKAESPKTLTPADILKNAAQQGVKGLDEVTKGLYELFGGGALKSGVGGFDAETYAKAKPHFEAGFQSFVAAGKSMKDFVRWVVDSFGKAAKPYLVHWAGDKKSGLTTDEKGPNIDSEGGDKDESEQIRTNAEGLSEGSGTEEIPANDQGEIPEAVLPGTGGGRVPGEGKPGSSRDEGQRGERDSDQRPADYTITNADGLGKGGPKQKYRDNLAAIRIIKSIGDRQATPEEQSILVKYVGWGGLPQAFPRPDGSIATGWDSEVNELRDLLSDEEYASARRSTQDAHYTSQTIIKGVYSALKRFGFKRGKILEPSVGTGNFIGLMPKGVRSKSHITGIELEPITAAIAKQLYPEQRILQSGFQDIFIAPGSFDAAVGNPPFGDQKLFDSENTDLRRFSIHNFFFAKSLKGLRENGILAMVVSSSMMDKVGTAQREWLNKHAELIGAIRLPNNAFKENALTEVTTDIIFLRKRAEGEREGENLTGAAWMELREVPGEEHAWRVNEYFAEHPEMMLGDLAPNKLHPAEIVDGVYDAVPGMIARKGVDLGKALTEAVERLPEGIFKTGKTVEEVQAPDIIVSDPGFAQPYGYTLDDSGRAVRRLPDRNGEQRYELATYGDQPLSGNRLERFKALLQLRDDIRKLIRAEVSDNPKMDVYRKHLNKHYDAFVEKYGYISAQVNSTILKHDPTDLPLLRSLEKDYSKGTTEAESKKTGTPVSGPSAGKSAIFTKRTRMPYVEATHAETVKDGLAISLRERGVVDVGHIAKLTGKPETEVVKGLEGLAFLDPDSDTWETADVYLSGNVKKKLKAAESAANRDDAYKVNVEALKKVIPEDVPPDLIHFRVGASWFPTDFYEDFAQEKLGSDMDVRHLEDLGVWVTRINNNGTSEFDTDQVSGAYIFNRMVKGQDVLVYAKDDKGTRYVDRDASAAAQERGTAIDRAFQDWVLSDGKRRDILAKNFNDKINVDVKPKFDGSHMIFPGMGIINAGVERDDQMRTHQKSAIWRLIQKGFGLLDHVVGSGKTFAAIATGLELKRMGLVKKPMYVVPNHLVPQWTEDFQKLYPGANVLAISRDDFSKANRQEFLARIATGDWDAVLIAHSSFGFIRMPSDYEMRFYQEQLDQLEEAMKAMAEEGGSRMTVKQMEKTRDRMRARMDELANRPIDAVVDFSELGVDAVFIDEAHEFKNLFYATKRSRIAGLSNSTGSKKAFDMFVKTQYVLETNNGRGVFFMTGTPVSNSIAEMYTMMRYMAYKRLKEMGAAHFDQWANIYASAVSDWEIDPTGTRYRYQTKMDFVNVPGMTAFYNDFADVVSTADLKRIAAEAGQIWPIPDIKGGKPSLVVAERSELQKNFSEYIVHRFDHMPKDPKIDNPLKATGEAMKAALDIRLIREDLPDHPGSKVNLCVNNIMDTYHKWNAKKGTQLVFCDLSVPKNARDRHIKEIRELRQKMKDLEQKLLDETNDEKLAAIEEEYTKVSEKFERFTPSELMAADSNFSVYDDVKAKLIAQGIPAHEIAFIHDAHTDKQKADLFRRVKSGRVRVLIGSTSKMGAGMNVQDRLVALHHLDAPWRPSDLEQREGRIIRQGNKLFEEAVRKGEKFEIEIFRYATKETLDTRRWQVIERKARSIEQFRQGNVQWGQKIEDAVGEASNAAEMKAAASGNPLILEEIQLRKQLDNLDSLKRSKRAKRFQYEKDIKNYKEYKDAIQGILDDIDADAKKALENPRDNTPQGWKISIDGQEFRAEGLKEVPKETTSEDKDEIKANKKAIKDAEEHNYEALQKAKERFETAITDALMGLYDKKAGSPGPTLIFRGFRFTSKRHEWRGTVNIEADIKAGGEHRSRTETELNPRGDGVSGVGIVARLNHIMESIAEEAYYSKNDKGVHLKWLEMKAREAEEQIPKLGDDNYDAEITEKQQRHSEVLAELQQASANQQDQDFDYSMWGGPSSTGGDRTSTVSSPAPPAEAPAETPAKYYRFVDEGGKRSFVPVPDAEPAEVTPWMETFVYQDKFSNVWHVVEITSGLSISYGDTKTEAIENSIQAVERAGEAGVKNAVKLGVEQHKDVSRPQYSAKIAPGKALELADIQDIFRGYPLGMSANDKSVWIELPSGTLRIKTVQRIAEDKAAFEVAHKRKRKPYEALVGKYMDSKVEIHADLGDKYTLVHELEHFAEDIGLLTNGEIFAINRALREEGKEANAENRADWVEEHLYSREMDRKTRKGRIIQKIEDFIGSLVNLFKKTTGGVLRAFESGKLFGRQGKKGAGAQVPLFSMAGSTWYSQMQDFLSKKLPGKGDPKQIKSMIESWANKGEFKTEELEWSGISEWLDGQVGKVSKQDVLDFLSANSVQIQEVEKRDAPTEEEIDTFLENAPEFDQGRYEAGNYLRDVKFQNYQLPEGDNYKELLLTLPDKPFSLPGGYSIERMANGEYTLVGADGVGTLLGVGEKAEALSEAQRRLGKLSDNYRSGHWDEPNVLAHVRFNERTGPNGEKVLFLEEVQSDWHQEGRKKGYKNGLPDGWEVREAPALAARVGNLWAVYDENGAVKTQAPTKDEAIKYAVRGLQGVPDAPFKKTWPMLAIKRMVRYAAENGFDSIAWTPGDVQAERYDLSKHISSIFAEKHKDSDGYHIVARNHVMRNGIGNKIVDGNFQEKDLEANFGKEIAEKIISHKGDDPLTLAGLDLKVGGEGMKGFYDKILPSEINKFFGKKAWGNAKVGQIGIITESGYADTKPGPYRDLLTEQIKQFWSMPITPEMRRKALHEGMPLFQTADADAAGRRIADKFNEQYPGYDVRYDGVQGMSPLNKPDLYQFTIYGEGSTRGATFLSKTLSVEGVKERVDDMVRKRMPQYSVRVVRSEDPKVNAKADALLKKLLAVFPKGVPDAKKTLRALNRYEDLAQTLRDDKKDIYEKQKALEEHVKAELSLEDRGRALPLIKNISRPVTAAGREKMLQRAINRVNEIHEKVDKSKGIKAIRKLLKPRKRGHKKGVASHEGLSIEAQGIIKEIREVVKMSDEEAAAEIEALMRAMDQDYSAPLSERQEDVIDETETARRLSVLQTFSGLEGKSASDVELARDMLVELLKSGRLELSERIKAEREERKELREMAVETITGGQGIKSGNVERLENAQHRQTFWGRIKDKLRSFDDMHQSYEFLLDKLSRFDTESDTLESDLTKRYARMTFDATENEQAGVQACQNLLVQKLSEIWGVKGAKLGRVLQKNSTLKKKTGVTQATEKGRTEIPLSQNQAYKLWQMFQQPTIREEMQSQGYDIQTLMELEQFIDPKIKQWAQWQIDEFYPNYRDGVNKIFKDLFYTNMPKIENYSPISRVYYGKTEDEAMLTDSGFFASVVPGALYSRKNNARDFNILDGDTVLLKHIVDLEHFKAWGKPMREIRSVLGSEQVQRAIKQYHGRTANQVFQQFHNDFASGGKNNGQSLQLLDTMRANFTRAVIGANPVVFLKQLSSIPAYTMDIPVKDFAKGFAYALMHPIEAHKTLMESKTMQARYRVGFERDIILAMQRDVPKTITGQVNISDLLMLSTKLGDKLAIIAGGWSVYAYHLKRLTAQGMGRDAAHKEALHQFDRATKRSQQAGDTIDLGYIQRSWGSIGKLFTMFMTAPTSYYRSTSAGVRNIVAKRGGANVKRVLVSWPLLSMLFQFVADGFDWEPEKQAKAALLGPLNGLFIVRDLVGTMSAALFEGVRYWTAGAPPPLTTANLGAQAMARINKMIKEGMTDEDFAKTMFDLAEFAGNLTGIPVGPLERVWSGMRDAATGETEHPIRRSMGFSENALGSDD